MDNTNYSMPFNADMKKTHKILIPQMCPVHFEILLECISRDGYDVEIMENEGQQVVNYGLQYVNNDACYPAVLVIGQFIEALKSGRYDLDRIVLAITQTGGGCRASNYIHMLRRALARAGYQNIPVVSLNFSGLEEGGLKLSMPTLAKATSAVIVADAIVSLASQTKPYEAILGETERLVAKWTQKAKQKLQKSVFLFKGSIQRLITQIAGDFAKVERRENAKVVKVGVVGEIYVKYAPFGNNHLEEFLHSQGCEVCVLGLMGFIQYCLFNSYHDISLYGGSKLKAYVLNLLLKYLDGKDEAMASAIRKFPVFYVPPSFEEIKMEAKKNIGLEVKMGEGWLLTGEMGVLCELGFTNIVCAQPFGCLPNHIVGKGMITAIRSHYPQANIMPIDYDPGASKVNQENRLKLMLSTAARA